MSIVEIPIIMNERIGIGGAVTVDDAIDLRNQWLDYLRGKYRIDQIRNVYFRRIADRSITQDAVLPDLAELVLELEIEEKENEDNDS